MQPLTAQTERRDLRSITADGVFFSAMVGLGETYVPTFALALGLGDVVAGLIATVPMLAGAVLQLATPWGVRRLRSYRRWVVGCAFLQAVSFVPLVIAALVGHISIFWLAFATVAYWGFGMATSPAWNAWITSLVRPERRTRFLAHRTRLAQAALFIGVSTGGVALEWGRSSGRELWLFAALFVTAMSARFVSAWFLSRQSEDTAQAAAHHALGPPAVVAAIREAQAGRIFVYLLCMQTAVNVASPFFTPYMLGPLELSYIQFMMLTATAFLARIVVLPLLGRAAERFGVSKILWWGAVGIVPLPPLWLVSNDFLYLTAVQAAAGVAWAALEYATLLSFLERIPDRVRASVLTAYNLANAIAITIGALIGSQIFLASSGSVEAFGWLFVVSSAGRLMILLVLRGVHAAEHAGPMPLRALAVRPSAGAIERPILAGLEEDVERDERP